MRSELKERKMELTTDLIRQMDTIMRSRLYTETDKEVYNTFCKEIPVIRENLNFDFLSVLETVRAGNHPSGFFSISPDVNTHFSIRIFGFVDQESWNPQLSGSLAEFSANKHFVKNEVPTNKTLFPGQYILIGSAERKSEDILRDILLQRGFLFTEDQIENLCGVVGLGNLIIISSFRSENDIRHGLRVSLMNPVVPLDRTFSLERWHGLALKDLADDSDRHYILTRVFGLKESSLFPNFMGSKFVKNCMRSAMARNTIPFGETKEVEQEL